MSTRETIYFGNFVSIYRDLIGGEIDGLEVPIFSQPVFMEVHSRPMSIKLMFEGRIWNEIVEAAGIDLDNQRHAEENTVWNKVIQAAKDNEAELKKGDK